MVLEAEKAVQLNPPEHSASPDSDRSFATVPWRLPLICAAIVLLLDQVTKLVILHKLAVGESLAVLSCCFRLVHYRNTGAAWGMFQGQTLLLAAFSIIILAGLVWKFQSLVEGRWERAAALGCVAGGTLGNLIDRLFRGEVVDFLLFFFGSFEWPAFNVADSAICCGIAVYIFSTVVAGGDRRNQKGRGDH